MKGTKLLICVTSDIRRGAGGNINLHLASGSASLDCVVEHRLRDNQKFPRGREHRQEVGIKRGVGFVLLIEEVGQGCGRGNRKGERPDKTY